MKKKKQGIRQKLLFAFTLIFFSVAIVHAQTTGPTEEHPLAEYSEVIETKQSIDALFNDTRSYFLDKFSHVAGTLASSSNTMLSISLYRSFRWIKTATLADLRYTLVAEFREGRMRFSTKDVRLVMYDAYKREWVCKEEDLIGKKGADGKLLANGAVVYKEEIENWKAIFKEIAEGKLQSDW